jgi:hypothetical protein
MPRLTERQADRSLGGIGRHPREQRAQLLERIGLEQGKPWIHASSPCAETTIIAMQRIEGGRPHE